MFLKATVASFQYMNPVFLKAGLHFLLDKNVLMISLHTPITKGCIFTDIVVKPIVFHTPTSA